jgi:hypothetical protein
MPATMPSVTSHPDSNQNRKWAINRQQLRAVFSLCDPEGTGFVSLEHLLQLGRAHCGGNDTKVSVKGGPAIRHGGAWGERKYSSYSFLTSALYGGEWSSSRPGRPLPRGKDLRYPF